MTLFETFNIDVEPIRTLVKAKWEADLGDCLKSAQNQTYKASKGEKTIIIRMTPYSEKKHDSITKEVKFLLYAGEKNLPICKPIATNTDEYVVSSNNLIITAFEYATGEAIDYFSFSWLTDTNQIRAVGRWFGLLHNISEQYELEYPEMAKSVQLYSENLSNTLENEPVHEDDVKLMSNPHHYGILHGDINPTNYFFDNDLNLPCVFDWDQMQRGWFLFDLSQPIWGIVILGAGNPIDKSPVPDAAYPRVLTNTNILLEGYQETREGEGKNVNRDSLRRMVILRKAQYLNFCSRAIEELEAQGAEEGGSKSMLDFCRYIVGHITTGGANIEHELREL